MKLLKYLWINMGLRDGLTLLKNSEKSIKQLAELENSAEKGIIIKLITKISKVA